MKTLWLLPILCWLPQLSLADCALNQQFCRTECEVRYFTDEAAVTGCKARCAVERAICSTGEGAETAVELGREGADAAAEVGKEAWEDTKSFVKGISEP